jgi:dephospho-CoA kinase
VSVFTVALTGGVASGKSEVARLFAERGAHVIDADVVARELVAPASPALREIVATFGNSVLDDAGGLDRTALRERVFGDDSARAQLEAILHPRVRRVLRDRADSLVDGYALLVIPLFVESGAYGWVDRVLVVDAAPSIQRARLLARDAITLELADAMLASQATRERRLAVADDVIANDGARTALPDAVARLHRAYVEFARRKAAAMPGRGRSIPASPSD